MTLLGNSRYGICLYVHACIHEQADSPGNIMRFMLNYQRLEKIATAAVTLARRPHVSVPCQPMNRLLHQDQSMKPNCHDVTGPPLNDS